jgi:hypothetical protein
MIRAYKIILILLIMISLLSTACFFNKESPFDPRDPWTPGPWHPVDFSKALIHRVNPITTYRVLPNQSFGHGTLTDQLTIMATPGEFEPASFVITAVGHSGSFLPQATDLVAEGGVGVIPSENIEIKYVRTWFQAGTAWWGRDQDKSKRILVPELLVNDPDLVKVDLPTQQNYLKLTFPNRVEYVNISDPQDRGGRLQLSVAEYPVKDSPVLLPVVISVGQHQQVWVTVRIPKEADSGTYRGLIDLYKDEEYIGSIQLNVTVLPFVLSDSYHTSSIYYRGTLNPGSPGTISSETKSPVQFQAELQNMMDHGVINPIVYQPLNSLEQVLQIRQGIGMGRQPLYYLGVRTYSPSSDITQTLRLAAAYNIPEVYFYAVDEAYGEQLTAQRPDWIRTKSLGGKVFAAGWRDGNFELMGDLQDLHIRHDRLRPLEAANWHSVGAKIWSYGNPQTPAEDPELYRRNYGLMLWTHDYDGAAPYAYQDGFGNIWNDFDHPTYRDHVFTYPTVDGVIDTIAWEGYREGVDDLRYLTTLLEAIQEVKASSDPELLQMAKQAEQYLSAMNPAGDLYSIRTQMTNYILKLKQLDAQIPPGGEDGISFDQNLEPVIRELIGKPWGAILPADVSGITNIDARDKGITSLEGLQYCASLNVLRLQGNDVRDLSPLSEISGLLEVFLDDNTQITDISPLANHPYLHRLRIHRTNVTDFRAFDGHTGLRNIEYHGAKITDLSTLPSLPNLREFHAGWSLLENIWGIERFPLLWQVVVGHSEVTDLEPLLSLPALTTVWLDATQQQLPVAQTLRNRGVTIRTL